MTDKRIKELDAMVRDFTQVVPRSKSEVRQRISDYAQQQVQEAVEAILKNATMAEFTPYDVARAVRVEDIETILSILTQPHEGK